MTAGETSAAVDAKGLIQADANAAFKLTLDGDQSAATDATLSVDAQCIVSIELTLPARDAGTGAPMALRGVLVDGGKEILAIQTDPGAMVSAALIAP